MNDAIFSRQRETIALQIRGGGWQEQAEQEWNKSTRIKGLMRDGDGGRGVLTTTGPRLGLWRRPAVGVSALWNGKWDEVTLITWWRWSIRHWVGNMWYFKTTSFESFKWICQSCFTGLTFPETAASVTRRNHLVFFSAINSSSSSKFLTQGLFLFIAFVPKKGPKLGTVECHCFPSVDVSAALSSGLPPVCLNTITTTEFLQLNVPYSTQF